MERTGFIAAFEQAPFAMALVDAREPFRVLAGNAAFTERLQRVHADATGRPAFASGALRPALSPAVVELMRRVLQDGTPRTTVEVQTRPRRAWEVTLSLVDRDGGPVLLYIGRDVTPREEHRRRLEDTGAQLATLTAFARQSLSFDPNRVADGVVRAAAALTHGAAAVYLGSADEPLRRVAAEGFSSDRVTALPEVLSPARFPLLRGVLAPKGTTRVFGYAATGAADERLLLRHLGMYWAAAIPLRGHRDTLGVLVAFWRGPVSGIPAQDLPLVEACGAQLVLGFEHAELFREMEKERAGLALVLEQIPDAVVIADERGRVAHANPAARKLFAIAPGATTLTDVARGAGVNVGNVIGDLGLSRALAGETVRGSIGVVRRDGTEPAWVMSSAAPLRTSDGTATGAVAVATDITLHRRAEEALRTLAEISAALAGSLDYRGTLPIVARLLVPRVADVCAIDIEQDGAMTRVALACADSIAPDVARTLGAHALDTLPVQDDADGDVPVSMEEQVTEASLRALAASPEHRAALRLLALRSSLRVAIAARGRVRGALWLATSHSGRRYSHETRVLAEDIARRIAAAIDNASLFHEAQQADHRKDEFLAMLSHELRTPLAPIMAWIQILKRAADPERVRIAIEVIERNVRLQSTLIDDLLDLTAITRGKVTLDVDRHDLRTIVANALETVRTKTAEKSIVLITEIPETPLVVEGDGNRLQQVAWNLLTNAVKFSPQGERVLIALARDGDAAVLRVRDRGAGIAPEFLPHVFDMFQQQEHGDRRRYGGLGIGLAIVRSVTELHRGTIEVHSDGIGYGAEFRVRLPLASEQETHAATDAAAPSLVGRAVLLVEDVPDTREAARLMLEQMGVRVIDAAEGEEALAKLDEASVDVVLCDLRMPIMDGFELIRRIRANPRHRVLPVIAVSGYATHDDEKRTREAGFDAYVRKPYVESTLAAAVERVIHERERASRSAASA